MSTACWQINSTTGSRDEAERIAAELIARRAAACVQISGPIRSVYRWQGTIETAEEWLLTIKSTAAKFPAVAATIRELHSYQTPEIVAVPIIEGNLEYLDWVAKETT